MSVPVSIFMVNFLQTITQKVMVVEVTTGNCFAEVGETLPDAEGGG